MGKIVLTEFISIDGVVEAPGGENFRYENWTFEFDRGDGERYKEAEALGATALLLGRKTYEGFSGAWPQYEGELADKYNSMPKYVVSRTLTDPKWAGTTVLSGDLKEEVTRLKQEVDGEISVAGSIQLAQGLLALDLVDEIHLMASPLVLGHGRRLWTDTPDKTAWTLSEATVYGDSTLLTVYQRRAV
ncbi:dihydrofolate reductase [Kribbella amoyensis]|uniref:Dihydrofolate reductase n=1 Tax=Kribbella amoyensis TaxID=996641 RepID=A0A561BPA8_9ACTN|nr:dihydrofolate reductase family protein [Kribbella amoyensis]TWD80700.1 dihydrofolate reductase [Kribbella amoyensis]